MHVHLCTRMCVFEFGAAFRAPGAKWCTAAPCFIDLGNVFTAIILLLSSIAGLEGLIPSFLVLCCLHLPSTHPLKALGTLLVARAAGSACSLAAARLEASSPAASRLQWLASWHAHCTTWSTKADCLPLCSRGPCCLHAGSLAFMPAAFPLPH